MSNILPSPRGIPSWFANALNRQICPATEQYLSWLRQPLSWFALATTACILIGATVAPIANSLAAGLIGLMTVGVVYPWLAVHFTKCELLSQAVELVEDESHIIQIRLQNCSLWPLWGLVIEGFVVDPTANPDGDDLPGADIALGWVPWLSSATYRVAIRPRLRGRYPVQTPRLTCAFPFGLWTARRLIKNVMPLVVYPKQVKLCHMVDQSSDGSPLDGHGQRSGGSGDFLGLREYRSGDSIRDIHWAHTARLDRLVVRQRGIAEQSLWHIVLDVTGAQRPSRYARENLAWRIRVAASLCNLLQQQAIPFQLIIPGEVTWSENAWNGGLKFDVKQRPLIQCLLRLTDVPLDGLPEVDQCLPSTQRRASRITIERVTDQNGIASVDPCRFIRLRIVRFTRDFRGPLDCRELIIDLDQSPALQINSWLQNAKRGDLCLAI